MTKLILKGSKRLNFICRSKKYVILFTLVEMSSGRNICGRNIRSPNSLSTKVLTEKIFNHTRERGGLVVNASESESRGRGFEPHMGQTVLCP